MWKKSSTLNYHYAISRLVFPAFLLAGIHTVGANWAVKVWPFLKTNSIVSNQLYFNAVIKVLKKILSKYIIDLFLFRQNQKADVASIGNLKCYAVRGAGPYGWCQVQ